MKSTTLTPTLTDTQLKNIYPLVSYRVVSLGDMAALMGTTPGALRSRAYHLGITDMAQDTDFVVTFLKKLCNYSWKNNATVEDYISDVINNEI